MTHKRKKRGANKRRKPPAAKKQRQHQPKNSVGCRLAFHAVFMGMFCAALRRGIASAVSLCGKLDFSPLLRELVVNAAGVCFVVFTAAEKQAERRQSGKAKQQKFCRTLHDQYILVL